MHNPPMTTTQQARTTSTGAPVNDYAARQRALRAAREAEGYYTPEQVAEREARLQASRDYNSRIAGEA